MSSINILGRYELNDLEMGHFPRGLHIQLRVYLYRKQDPN